MHNRLPTHHYLVFSRPKINNRCPRCNTLETTIHILRDCLWPKVVWCQSSGILSLSFFPTTTSNLDSNKRHIGYTYPPPLASLENALHLPFLAFMVS